MGRALIFDAADYTDNLRSVFARASQADYREGVDWYPYAGGIARSIAAETGHDVDSVAAIISALSPRQKWAGNVDSARRFCAAAADGSPERPRTQTYNANAEKAWRIACGEPWFEVLRGIKVESFVANIHGDLTRVTVDTWALRAATLGAEDEVRTDAQYRAVEQAYRTVAAEVGLMPAELQAVVWVAVRRMCGAARTAERRAELLAA